MQTGHEVCPFLGLEGDPALRLTYIDSQHRCYALSKQGSTISEETQSRLCFGSEYSACSRFAAAGTGSAERSESARPVQPRTRPGWLRLALWVVAGLLLLLAGIGVASTLALPAQPEPAGTTAPDTTDTPAPVWPTPPPAATVQAMAPVADVPDQPAGNQAAELQPTPTPGPDTTTFNLAPAAGAAGWVSSDEVRGNHLGDSYLHAGLFAGQLFHGVIQFDLERVPRGAPIRYAALDLSGLDDDRLDREADGVWEVRWLNLAPELLEDFGRITFQDIHNAAVAQTLLPPLGQADLAPLAVNQFALTPNQLALLEQAVVDGQTLLTLRLDGPQVGDDNLFTWDSGQGPATRGAGPSLVLVTGPAPATPPPVPTTDYVVVTSTPTPENVLTAAAIVETATAVAGSVGTATPTPRAMVTATPTPLNEETAQAERLRLGLPVVITATPTPANQATETMIAQEATAVAQTTGTYTPVPAGQTIVTATPTPTFVVVTNTPTPASIATMLAQVAAEATRVAEVGPPTPFPSWVATATPQWIVVTSTPRAENRATAQAYEARATILALTTGTYTPTPPNLATATWTPVPTPLPLLVPLSRLTATPTPQPTRRIPDTIPDSLRGTIIFMSDRLGDPRLFVMDSACVYQPEGCANAPVSWLTQSYPQELAREQQTYSPDGRARALVQPDANRTLQVFVQEFEYDVIRGLTSLNGSSYDPAWSPRGDLVAFVSTDPGNDEIYVINTDGSDPRRLTTNSWEWDKHPTWSPDGSQILFYSNRESGRRQLWIMNADGSNLRNISNNGYNDWDPVWVK